MGPVRFARFFTVHFYAISAGYNVTLEERDGFGLIYTRHALVEDTLK